MSEQSPVPYQLQTLSPKHKQAMSLLAQGVDRATIGQVCEFAPEYITWLARQEVCQQYLRDMRAFSEIQLQAMFGQVVDVIQSTLNTGSEDGKLKAAKLQLEATNRIGNRGVAPPEKQSDDRLEKLGERLLKLLSNQRERTFNGNATVYEEGEVSNGTDFDSKASHGVEGQKSDEHQPVERAV